MALNTSEVAQWWSGQHQEDQLLLPGVGNEQGVESEAGLGRSHRPLWEEEDWQSFPSARAQG